MIEQDNAGHARVVGVMGGAACTAEEGRTAWEVGRRIAEGGAVLLCGGMGGIMEQAARGAFEAGGVVLGILPGRSDRESPSNPFVTHAVYTGMGDGRNVINVLTAEVIIAVGGGWGTLSEIALARKNGKPVITLGSWILDHPTFMIEGLHVAGTPEEAVRLALGSLSRLNP